MVLEMSTKSTPTDVFDPIGAVLFGRTRKAVLRLLFLQSDRRFYLRQISRRTGVALGAVQRELDTLTRCGLIRREREGRQVYFQASAKNPIFTSLKEILVRTCGLAEPLRERLLALGSRCRLAFIYGSFADGREDSDSDIDVMCIGEVSFSEASDALGSTQETLGREVNPSVYTPAEFSRKRTLPFIKSVLTRPKVFLIGTEDELARLVE